MRLYPFQINQKGSPHLQIWPLGQALPHSFWGILSSALLYPIAGLRRRKSARVWKEGREDETCEGGKVIGGLVSSIPGEKRELPPVTGGGKGPEYHIEIKRYGCINV